MVRRYSLVRQNDQSDCGSAALATIARHYRMPVGLEQLRDLSGTDRVGTTLNGLLRAAEQLGFSARAVHGPFEALPGVPLPAIAHVRNDNGQGHFVVLHQVKKGSVLVADPAHTHVERMSRADFCCRWTGYLLLLTPRQHMPSAAPGSAPVSPFRRLLGLLGCHRPILAQAFVCALLMTALGVATSFYIQHLVDSVLGRGESRLLHALSIGMVLIVLFRVLFGALRQYLLAHVSRKIDLNLAAGYVRHLMGLPLQFFELRRVGEILSRLHDADKVREAISGTTLTAVVDATVVLLTLIVLWIYDWPLALMVTAFIPVLLLGVTIHHPACRRKSRESLEQSANLSAHFVENVAGVETVKAFGAERSRIEEGESLLVRLLRSLFGLQLLGLSMSSLGTLITGLAGVVVLWYGGSRVMSNLLTVGELMFFYSLLNNLLEPLFRLTSVNVKLQEALHAIDRLYQVLDLPVEPAGERGAPFARVRDAIELQDVGFHYSSRGEVLDKVNLRIPAGKTVAIVGESGSGKTTLLKLLLGYYRPTAGRLLADGTDLRDFDLASLRAGTGFVGQEAFVFNGTVRENIALGRPEAPLADVIEAARAAGLEEFINVLPQRYDTIIGERGANLSGGQRQRLAIARALLRKPDLLVFDEATSHLDTATERAIQESLHTVLAGRTVVLVAHRLSTVRKADRIFVLHQGRVVEEGSHAELLARQGHYAQLWRAQTESEEASSPTRTLLERAGCLNGNGHSHS
jgi:ATP-binding cassette subfamily B protein